MAVPRVAIVGRPNVGKSSILNWLARHRVSIVDPTAGVTRDRVTHLIHEGERWFELIDTGGIGINDVDELDREIEQQIQAAIEEATAVVFVVDGQQGLTPLDEEVSRRLWKLERPVLLVINKCDSTKVDRDAFEFHRLVHPDAPVVMTSVKGNRNRAELLESLLTILPEADELEAGEGENLAAMPEMKLAVVGRRNVGKSTFINAVAEEERMIVSEVAGTTRDSVDIRFERDGLAFIAIDTPGVRKRKSLANDVEYYGLLRAQRSIRRADVVLMFFDSQSTISRVDKQLVDEIHQQCKPCIFVVNKWDLALEGGMTSEKWGEYLEKSFGSMRHVPVAFVTALTSKNVHQLINLAQSIFKQSRTRVSTGRLNKVVREAIKHNPPPHRKNRRPKIYFVTQVATQPPMIVAKCNDATVFDETWKRYLLGVLREKLPFHEVPIRLYLRPKDTEEASDISLEDQADVDQIVG